MHESRNLLNLLLIEDDDDHVELVRRAIAGSRIANRVTRVVDGNDALAYLHARAPYTERPRPDIVLLDLKLPGTSGHELLHAIKSDAKLCDLPVVILTTSDNETDHVRTYLNHADAYLVKPLTQQSFVQLIEMLGLEWGMVRPAAA